MTQLFLDDAGQRALPIIPPFQQGLGTRADTRVTREDVQTRFNDVVELDRQIGAEEARVFEPLYRRLPSDYLPPPPPFDNGPVSGFSFDRDVAANIYATNEGGGDLEPGGRFDLVA